MYVCKHVHDYIWFFFFLVYAPKGLFGECRAVTVTELNYSYSEANVQTCIKAPKWVSVFVGSSLRARSQLVHRLLHVERNLVKAFLYFLKVSLELGKDTYTYGNVICFCNEKFPKSTLQFRICKLGSSRTTFVSQSLILHYEYKGIYVYLCCPSCRTSA